MHVVHNNIFQSKLRSVIRSSNYHVIFGFNSLSCFHFASLHRPHLGTSVINMVTGLNHTNEICVVIYLEVLMPNVMLKVHKLDETENGVPLLFSLCKDRSSRKRYVLGCTKNWIAIRKKLFFDQAVMDNVASM